MNKRVTTAALAFLAVSASALAEVKLNDNFSVGGYVVGSYKYSKSSGAPSDDLWAFDAVKTSLTASFKPVTGVLSLYYPYNDGSGKKVRLLDAYATLDVGQGYSVTAGNFLSYLGYEAFDPVNMTQITYGAPTSGPLFAIPAYHAGARIDYSSAAHSYGAAVLDSVYNGPNIVNGDLEISHNAGFEAFYKYTGTENLTVFAAVAYDTKGQKALHPDEVLTLDFWAEYKLDDKNTIALEVSRYDGGTIGSGTSWLAYYGRTLNENVSLAFRVSGTNLSSSTAGTDYTQFTVCPTYKISKNFSVRAEYSRYDYTGGTNANFYGVQALLKF